MEVDRDYPEDISSFAESKLGISDLVRNSSVKRTLDLLSPTKKRKFLAENKEQLQASKYICSEAFVECSPFSVQAKLFYAHTRKGKTSSLEMADSDSTQDSNSMTGDSFSQCSDTKSTVYAKVNSYEESSCSSSHSGGAAISGDAFYSMNSTTMVDEFEENVDEFGHCLEYLAAACEGDNKTGERDEDEDEELLYSNAMSCLTSSECLTAGVTQLSMGKATIDQEFEHYFSTLML